MSHIPSSLILPVSVFRAGLRWSVLFILLVALVIVVGINLYFPRSLPADPATQVVRLQQANLPVQAESVLKGMVLADPLNLGLNYQYINNHFDIITLGRDDNAIQSYYLSLTHQSRTADVGYYGLGLIATRQENYRGALDEYLHVANKDQKYLNNSIGRVYLLLGDDAKAEPYFQREVDLGGNVAGAVQNMSALYLEQNRFDRIRALVDDPRTGKYVSMGVRRYLAFRSGDMLTYAQSTFLASYEQLAFWGIFGALLICAMWFCYFWRIDVFEQEPLSLMLAALVMGAAAAFASPLLTDTLTLVTPLSINPNWPQQVVYSILNIGLVEEVCKFAPVLLIALWSRQINEPLDLLIYGGLSALGFATLENSLYFSDYGLSIVFTRFLTSTVMHLAMTGMVCYAWAQSRYLKRGNALFAVLGGLGLAAVIHGLYDFFILGDLRELSILSVGLMIVMAWVYSRMITNCLDLSPLFDEQRAASRRLLNYNLLASTAILTLLMAFLYNSFNFSTEIADNRLIPLGWATAIAAFVVLKGLGAFRLTRGRVLGLR